MIYIKGLLDKFIHNREIFDKKETKILTLIEGEEEECPIIKRTKTLDRGYSQPLFLFLSLLFIFIYFIVSVNAD